MGAIFVRGEGGRSFLRLAKSVTRFEKVASSFEKRATTCTEHVMFESLLFHQNRKSESEAEMRSAQSASAWYFSALFK